MKSRKLINLFLSMVIILNIISPLSAIAATAKTYAHDGYTINYSVVNSWVDGGITSNQQIRVT